MTHSEFMKQQLRNTLHFLLKFVLPTLIVIGTLILLSNGCSVQKHPPYYHVDAVKGALECENMCEDVGAWFHQYSHYSAKPCTCRELHGLSWVAMTVFKGPQGDTKKQYIELNEPVED